jgi:tetratricopeptide (TPR) repeat protein
MRCMITAIAMIVALGVAAADSEEAARLWGAGRDLMKVKDYERACAKFTRAVEMDPRPGYEANLAECHKQLKHLRQAWQLYRDAAARWARTGEPDDALKAQGARDAAASVARDATTVVIGVSQRGLSDLTVMLNGETLKLTGRDNEEIREVVDPGRIEVVATARGYRTFTRTRTASPGDSFVVEVELVKDVPSANHRTLFLGLAIGLGAGAIATGGTGLFFAFDGSRKYDEAKNGPHCDGKSPPTCDAAGSAALADGQRLADVGTWLGVGAGALALGAIAFYVFAPADVQVVPAATASSAGVSVGWRF